MKTGTIQSNDVVKLKEDRRIAYGLQSDRVFVDSIEPHKTYKKNWIVDIDGNKFQEKDFAERVGTWS